MKYVLVVISAFILFGCEDYLDFMKSGNYPPVVKAYSSYGTFSSSFSDSLKLPSELKTSRDKFYRIRVQLTDAEGGLSSLSANVTSGNGVFTMADGSTNLTFDETGYAEFIYTPDENNWPTIEQQDEHTLQILARDNFGAIGIATIKLLVFINIKPVAKIKDFTPGSGFYEYELDASTSFDQDKAKGGQIVSLEWTVQKQNSSTSATFTDPLTNSTGKFDGVMITKMNFDGTGTYIIKLVAIDNDGGRSESVTKTLQI